jgi:hypothetical protein
MDILSGSGHDAMYMASVYPGVVPPAVELG